MKKIKLTKDEKKACRDVIAFWKKVEKRLVAGEKIDKEDGFPRWVKDGDWVIDYDGRACPFCKVASAKFWSINPDVRQDKCSYCVYYRVYGIECNTFPGHLTKFRRNSNLRTCRSAIQAVQWILANSEAR